MPYQRSSVQRIPADPNQPLQQVQTPQGLVNVESASNGYALCVYYPTNVAGVASNGLYTLVSGASPYVSWTVSNPGGDTNTVQLTENRGGAQHSYSYAYTLDGSTDTWTLTRPDGSYSISQKADGANNGYTRTFELHNADTTLVRKTQRTYDYFAALNDVLLTQLVEGDGSVTRTNTYTYYTDTNSSPPAVRLQRVIYADGNWAYYKYDTQGRKVYQVLGLQQQSLTGGRR